MNAKLEYTSNLEFQINVVNRDEGRFVPYIGKDYNKGLVSKDKKNQTNLKILVIGPRHYCDARNSSRNLLAYLTKEDRESIICGKSTYFPKGLKVGCIKDSAEECLKKSADSCPVFRNIDTRCCPLSMECNLWVNFTCNKERNLRCETLIAIKDYLDSTRTIESDNVGRDFFNSIANLIDKEYKPKSKDAKYIWSCIAFSNLIQRYISTAFTENQEIQKKVRESDRQFIKEVIEQLKPHVIIATNKCVSNILKTVVRKLHYGEWKSLRDDFHICDIFSENVISEEWKVILNGCIEACPFWKKSSEYNGFINGAIDELKDMKDRGMITISQLDEVLAYVRELLTEKIETGLKAGEKINKTMFKNFRPEGNYYQLDGVTTMSQWLRKYEAKSAIQKKAYEAGKRVLK